VLAADNRLASRLQEADLLPIASRIRARLHTEALDPCQLLQCLNHLLKMAGNPKLVASHVICGIFLKLIATGFLTLFTARS
jgi:hypothetical protein